MGEIKKIRYDYIDILKVIAIIMVIILHSIHINFDFIASNSIKSYIMFFLRILCEGVPIFVCVNGFLIINKPLDIKKHYLKTLKILGILLLWSLLNVVIIKLLNNECLNIKDIINNVLKTDISNKYTGPLWFLQNLIMLYLIYPALKVVHDNNKRIYNHLFICVTFFTVGMNLLLNSILIFQGLTNIKIASIYSFFEKYNPISNGNFIFFFMLGGYIFEYKDKLQCNKKRLIGITIGVVSCIYAFIMGTVLSKISGKMVAGSFNYGTVFMAGIIISLFSLFYKYKNHRRIYNKIIEDLGKNSLGIYLVHKIIIVFINRYVSYSNVAVLKLLVPLCVLVISYILVKIIKKIPIVHKIVEL